MCLPSTEVAGGTRPGSGGVQGSIGTSSQPGQGQLAGQGQGHAERTERDQREAHAGAQTPARDAQADALGAAPSGVAGERCLRSDGVDP